MSGLPDIGNEFLVVGGDPELRFTPSGVAVTTFRVKAAKRKLVDQQNNRWEDDKVFWARVTCWRDLAEHVAESIADGDLVIVVGEAYVESFEDKQGVKRQAMCIEATRVGPSMQFRTFPHGQGGQQNNQGGQQGNQQGNQQNRQQGNQQGGGQQNRQQQEDPWATPQGSNGSDQWDNNDGNEPPF